MRVLNIAFSLFFWTFVYILRTSASQDGVDFMEQAVDDNALTHGDTVNKEPEIPRTEEPETQPNQLNDSETQDREVDRDLGKPVDEQDEVNKGKQTKEGEKGVTKTTDSEKGDEIKHEDKNVEVTVEETTGNATNCGPKESRLSFHWTPAIIDPQGTVKVTLQLTAPVSFNNGIVTIDVAVRGQSHPIFTIAMDVSCKEDIAKNMPKGIVLHCPIQKGTPFPPIRYEETNLTRLPTGAFDVRIKLTNENGQEFLCMQFSAEFKSDD